MENKSEITKRQTRRDVLRECGSTTSIQRANVRKGGHEATSSVQRKKKERRTKGKATKRPNRARGRAARATANISSRWAEAVKHTTYHIHIRAVAHSSFIAPSPPLPFRPS